ncbi:hypothetical protein GCM10010269_75310 [Streptomyces humidus]|uniref:Lysoplasmalogenase n=1 Tax=Streptomyces humidus TaxID=52259 RepID=A0A918GA41_9ACTN|nr:lysoplasmalogenase [Streptomyces humidus]GGS25617.1 hypothetical protein GCM10010269_75310 [Streptomyces humidus]
MTRSRVLLALCALAAAVDLLSLAVGFGPGHALAKPLLMPLLAAWAAPHGAPRLLLAALACGWAGDTLLLFDADPAFLGGMACFAAGHVCYLVLFARVGRPHARAAVLAPCYAVVLVATVVLLWPGLPQELRPPVAMYSALLTAMACTAAVGLGPVAGAGGLLFLLSDTLIAGGVAHWPQPPRPDLWIMLTYLAAQFLLVRGVLDAVDGRPSTPDGQRQGCQQP